MAYRLGIANGYRDLLTMLHGFVTSYKMIDNIVYDAGNTGTGNMSGEWANDDSGVVEDVWTIDFTSATTFTVTGADSSHGLQINTGVVGVHYITDGGEVGFRVVNGQVAWANLDTIDFEVVPGMASTQKWGVNRYNMVYDIDIDTGDPTKGNVGNPNYVMEAPAETWSLVCTNIGTPAVFSVTGSVSGVKASATVDVPYDNDLISFTITAGVVTAWAVDDVITIDVPQAREIFFEAPGNGGNENIYSMIRTYENLVPGDDIYHWILNGSTGFLPENNFYNQPNTIPQQTDSESVCPRCCQADESQAMPYWIVANGRRVMMFYEVDTVYECMHLGYILPYALPTEEPYALMIGGSTARVDYAFNYESVYHRAFWDGGHIGYTTWTWASCYIWQQQVPCPIGNTYNDANPAARLSNILSTANFGATWPFHDGYNNASANSENYYWAHHAGSNVDGSLCLYPIIAHCRVGLRGVYGAFEGLYATIGDLTFAKDITVIDGKTYVAFPNTHRSSRESWCLLRLE